MGAKIGYIISGAIVLLIALAILAFLLWPTGIDPPTSATTDWGKLITITVNTDFTGVTVMPVPGSGAETFYADAVTEMMKGNNPSHFLNTVKKSTDAAKDFPTILDLLLKASDTGIGDEPLVFTALPVNAKTSFATRDGLYGIGVVAGKAAMDIRADLSKSADKDKSRTDAERALRAELVFGFRLWKLAPYLQYRAAGLGLMRDALEGYKRHYSADFFPDATRLAIAARLAEDMRQVSIKWADKEEHTIRVSPPEMKPGDLANLADNDQDRCWRIEGAIWLGLAKWTAAGSGQRAAIDRFLESHSHAGDPLLAQAAKEAHDFSRDDVRDIQVVPSD